MRPGRKPLTNNQNLLAMRVDSEKCVKLWASNGVFVTLPMSVMTSTVVSEVSHLTKVEIPERVMNAARKAIGMQPKQPNKEMREELYDYCVKVWGEIIQDQKVYERANDICSRKYADYQIMYRLR